MGGKAGIVASAGEPSLANSAPVARELLAVVPVDGALLDWALSDRSLSDWALSGEALLDGEELWPGGTGLRCCHSSANNLAPVLEATSISWGQRSASCRSSATRLGLT